MELTQLFHINRRRRPSHEIHGGCRLREGDHFPNRRLAAEERHDTVEPECYPAMRRRAVLERLEEEAEPQLRLLFTDPERPEDPRLNGCAMDSNAAAAN